LANHPSLSANKNNLALVRLFLLLKVWFGSSRSAALADEKRGFGCCVLPAEACSQGQDA
jgi:hypothetical protein